MMEVLRHLARVLFFLAGYVACCGAAVVDPASPQPTDEHIRSLIQQLGDPEYQIREHAQRELSQMGFAAFDALSEAENHEDIEVAAQAKYLVDQIRVDWTRDSDPPQIKRIFKGYESLATPQDRLTRVKQLGDLPGDLSLPWLCRVARFEQSHLVAKEAALIAIKLDPAEDEKAWVERSKTVHRILDRSNRPAARWLRTFVKAHDRPEEALQDWKNLVQAEEQILEHYPQQSHYRFISELLKAQVNVLDQLKRPQDALAVMRKIVQIERGDVQSLTDLVQWLSGRKAWVIIDEMAAQFASTFNTDPMLLYTLAQSRLAKGDTKLAAETAAQALGLTGNKAIEHLSIGAALQTRGMIEWSNEEWRAVIRIAPLTSLESLQAQAWLSESLHDRGLEKDAGEVLKPLVEAMDRDPKIEPVVERLLPGRSAASIRSRMYFFSAKAAGNIEKQTELLEKAINCDPTDVDVLIGLYHLPNQDAAHRKRTMDLIRKAAEECRGYIEELPDEADPYNQLAWLIANTEGDFDEAIRLSHKSIEIKRAAGYLDTLGHCYFAKKDYENAVRYQSEAAKLDPHSQQIIRKLAVFRAALAQTKKAP